MAGATNCFNGGNCYFFKVSGFAAILRLLGIQGYGYYKKEYEIITFHCSSDLTAKLNKYINENLHEQENILRNKKN
ncbi:hypothetical protein A3860_08765 [Niastella vici]|uniref:Uncharacterized protein n=1 Tax=Niastella vici TaxID=1703345 RepID=A0A1V9FH67_9BACT|nr:hypothetical protein A3860_08765 [Niastella vici]